MERSIFHKCYHLYIFKILYWLCLWLSETNKERKPYVELIPPIFSESLMTFSLHEIYVTSDFIFPGIIFLWIFIEAATSSVPDFEHLNNIRNLFLAQPSEFEVLCIYFWKTKTWT